MCGVQTSGGDHGKEIEVESQKIHKKNGQEIQKETHQDESREKIYQEGDQADSHDEQIDAQGCAQVGFQTHFKTDVHTRCRARAGGATADGKYSAYIDDEHLWRPVRQQARRAIDEKLKTGRLHAYRCGRPRPLWAADPIASTCRAQ